MGAQPFLRYLGSRRPLVEAWLEAHAWAPEGPCAADLDRYLYAPLARFNAGAGKRVRPVLALLGCEACGGSAEKALPAGCAIELFQSAALIHDDIADGSELRRGEPSMHIAEGLGLAINAGDGALVQAAEAVLADEGLAPAARLAVLEEMMAMERRTLEGQALDLGWVRDGRWDLAESDYFAMATLKTAHYSAASPLVLGAIVAGADAEQKEALRSFGLDAGLAFQIADDLLNLTGDAEAQGKDFRSDITEGKRTLIAACTYERTGGAARGELVEILSSGTADPDRLARAVELMEEAGAIDHARATAEELAGRAVRRLERADIADDARETLVSMAHFFIERTN